MHGAGIAPHRIDVPGHPPAGYAAREAAEVRRRRAPRPAGSHGCGPAAVIACRQASLPVEGVAIVSPPFFATAAIAALGVLLIIYRQVLGVGAGPTDAYAWGVWKTFNPMVLTALGSGSFAIGLAAWVFRTRELRAVMRVALLISLLVYATSLIAFAVGVGPRWSFWNVLLPWRWNLSSPMAEVALCLPVYAFVPLLLENAPPLLERIDYLRPVRRGMTRRFVAIVRATYPIVVALAYVLLIMHQWSLGALMQVAGGRVHPLWQTPMLPVFYVWAAAFIGTASVIITLLLCFLAWKRPVDMHALRALSSLASRLALFWLAARAVDIIVRRQVGGALALNWYALVFWLEIMLIGASARWLRRRHVVESGEDLFLAALAMVAGGTIYRYAPSLAFAPGATSWYAPSIVESLISLGFIACCCLGFLIAVKRLPILPAPADGRAPGRRHVPAKEFL
jgi:Ni/Fe-hydrogenase subunit HybB-like protein